QLKALHPSWDDNTLYEEARRRVGAHIQAIVYEEWLPAMGISLPDYAGYDAGINPTISNEFSAAAFRLGHTLLNSHLHTMDNQGNVLAEIPLRDAFFNPPVLADMGLDPFFIGMAEQIQQEMDAKMVDEVRNFLFGTPGAGGLDLAAINIQRGRERGVPPFNILRADLGLSPYEDLEAFCDNPQIKQILLDYYGNINNIDAWVGLLLEEHMPGMLFGETIMHILMQQFGDLRDGDRYFYENDPYFPNGEIATIKETTFRDIIMRNTGVEIMQENVFEAIPHDSICMADGPLTDINGAIQTWTGLNVPNVNITATHVNDSTSITTTTLSDGTFLLEEAKSCAHYSLRPAKDGNYMNGVSTFDLVLISRHILEIEPLDSSYKIIAANVNNDDKVSTFDIVDLRKLILFVDTALANVDSWRFVDADYVFNDPTMPFDEDFPEYAEDHSVDQNAENLHFVAIKMGDVNGNADPEAFNENDTQARSEDELALVAIDQSLQAGQTIQVPVRSGDIDKVDGFQFALKMDRSALAFKGMTAQSLPALSASNIHYLEKEGLLLFSWNGSTDALNADDVLFTLQMEALREGQLSDFVHIHPHKLLAEAYAKNSLNILPLQWRFEQGESYPHSFTVLQNQPNPFRSQTAIAFQLPA
ncbi:MAG TPA: hypothetical protein ENJ45_06000, partial [Phaeodactylibacter sp.]|nr:hypothetical protein [Phaeodactylibacter sp.]